MTNDVPKIKRKDIKYVCKCIFDILIILLLSPIIILLSAAIFLMILVEQIFTGDYGPLLISEPRISRGRPFQLIKLNMFKESYRKRYREEDAFFQKYGSHGMLQRNPDALRFVGPFMKKFYVDELGQITNILKGEMSVVGPRPQPPMDISDSVPPRTILNTGIFCFKANK